MLVACLVLLSFQAAAPADPASIFKRLGSEESAVREAADRELRELARRDPAETRTLLKDRIAAEKDLEVRSRIQAVLRGPLALELVLYVRSCKVGEGVSLSAKVRNTSDVNQLAVRSLDGSSGIRYPLCAVDITGPDRKPPAPSGEMLDCLCCNPLAMEDFMTLKPGEEGDFVGAGGGWPHHALSSLVPSLAGRYEVTVTCDYASNELFRWKGSTPKVDEAVEKLWARVPKVTLKATIAFQVAK